jgi:hypothetical protein
VQQRNVTGYTLVLPTLHPPVEVPPDGDIDFDKLLAGFEPVDQPEDPAPPSPPPTPSTPPSPVAPTTTATPGAVTVPAQEA